MPWPSGAWLQSMSSQVRVSVGWPGRCMNVLHLGALSMVLQLKEPLELFFYHTVSFLIQANLDMTDSMGPGTLVHHMQNPSYSYDTYLICMGLGPSISSVIDKCLLYTGPS